jgi:hypothetical protein
MVRNYFLALVVIFLFVGHLNLFSQIVKTQIPPDFKVDTRIDNMGYWRQCAEWGLVPVEPYAPVPPAKYTGSKLILKGVRILDSPDVCTTNEPSNSTQSENSIVVNPNIGDQLVNSNNSTPQPSNGTVKGADALKSLDAGATWSGTVEGAGGSNSGDPAAVIDLNGRWFIGYIDNGNGQSVSYSDDNGATWTVKKVANGSFSNVLDKNHLWVDISPSSPYKNNLYNGWMSSDNIFVSRSITNGTVWTTPVNISSATSAGSHNQGINFKCGPDGEVYAAWAVYDSWPADEKAIGFAKSLNGGETWQPAIRALNNIRGIRNTGVSQNMRTNSFPVMAVDLSNSPYRGTIYIVWTNTGVPGINTGSGSSVYLIKSTDKGTTWSAPKRINSDSTTGKHHYLPWISCDQVTGYVSIVFYDNRNCASNEAEAWMAFSTNGGATFEDLKVSDVKFTPSPIPNMASKYMGDYLAIDSYNGKTFPCWTDTRSGHCLTYVSPIDILVPTPNVENIAQTLNDTTYGNGNGLMDFGETELIGLKMKNTGTGAADSVTVELSCDNPYISIIDNTENYGSFDPDQSKYIHNGYQFKVSDSIANHELVTFQVKATDKNDSVTWSSFQLMSQAPDVSILGMTVIDAAPGGNNNGRLDPGETAIISITTKNQGIWDAEQVVSNLMSMNGYVTVGSPVYNIGILHAGETVQANFTVNVHTLAPIGSVALLHNLATSKFRQTEREFSARIGLIIEDWETGNFLKFPWQFTNGSKPWTIDPIVKYEKLYSSKTGLIGDNESTGISVNYNVAINDSISFYKRVSTQPIKDILKFYIDDMMVGMWSNFLDTTFRRVAYPVMAGPHTFKWIYEKNGTVASGDDAGWIDYIVFPPQYKPAVYTGGDGEVCAGDTYQLHGMAYSYDSVLWVTAGDGTFNDVTLLNAVYTPGNQDIINGSVLLSLTAFAKNMADTTNTMTLTIAQAPVVNAGQDQQVCKGSNFSTISAIASNYNEVEWSTSGDGTFGNSTSLHTTYYPGSGDLSNGAASLTLTVHGNQACPSVTDQIGLQFIPSPVVELGRDTVLCAGQSIILNASTPDASGFLWTPSNKTTASITVDSAGIGLSSKVIGVRVTGQNGCITHDSLRVGFKVCGGIDEPAGVVVSIYPNPTNGVLTIALSSTKPVVFDADIQSSVGQVVRSQPGFINGTQQTRSLDLMTLPSGTYILKLYGESGTISRKFIIKK